MTNPIARKINRQHRVRSKLLSLSSLPRLIITRSNRHISAQLINRTDGSVICSFGSINLKSAANKVEQANQVGTKLGELIKAHKISQVVLDRGQYKFHGRVKSLAESIKKSGVKI